jgi:hypothetical protein
MSEKTRKILRVPGGRALYFHLFDENGILTFALPHSELGRKAAEASSKSDDDLLGHAAFLVFENASVYDYGARHVGSVNDFSFPHNLLEQTRFLELFVELGVKKVRKLRRKLNALRKGEVFDFHCLEAWLLIFGPQG